MEDANHFVVDLKIVPLTMMDVIIVCVIRMELMDQWKDVRRRHVSHRELLIVTGAQMDILGVCRPDNVNSRDVIVFKLRIHIAVME